MALNYEKFKKPILAVAPMAGVTDSAFRQMCKSFGADLLYTEMISADALYYDNEKTLEMLKFDKSESPIICQLFGSRLETFPKACKLVEKAGYDGIDLNFGCPAKKIIKSGSGVTLMKDLDHCHAIIKTVIESTSLPVSIKTRKSIGDITILDFLKKINDLDVKMVMIHGRSYEKPFTGEIDYEIIKEAKKIFPGIVLANGGINTPEDAKKTLELTGADGLGLARGLYGRPWLFAEINNALNRVRTEQCSVPSSPSEIKEIILKHAKLVGPLGIIPFRKHLLMYIKNWPNAKSIRQQLTQVETLEEIKNIIK